LSPPPVNTAQAQLDRLLWLIPVASRPGGIALDEAAEALGVPVDQIRRDVQALTERPFYHPAGTAEGLMVEITDRLEIHTTGQFGRPPRLTPRELLCVVLGLRGAGPRHEPLIRKLEERLAFADPGAGQGERGEGSGSGYGSGSGSGSGSGASDSGASGPGASDPGAAFELPSLEEAWHTDDVLAVLRQGWRHRQPVTFGYLRPGDEAPEVRRLHCWGLVHAQGRWYACGLDPDAGGPRNFRVDRILAARPAGDPDAYRIPDGFDPATVLDGARVFVPPEDREDALPRVVVRYGPAVTPWVREQWAGEEDGDGGYRVRHPVGDPGWVIRHVLEYGPEAEVLDPPELRDAMRVVAARMSR